MFPSASGRAAASAAVPLQPIVDQARTGETIRLASGTYLGPVIIRKSVTIEGDGAATIINDSANSAISVEADGTRLSGLMIKHQGEGDTAGVEVHARSVQLERLKINTRGHGMMLRDANDAVIRNNDIASFAETAAHPEEKGNGIDLYNAQNNNIMNNKIAYMRDAIYMENGRNETVQGNRVSYSRYGIHLMYIDDSQVADNTGEFNFTGAMVMVVSNTSISGNAFRMQKGNVNSQGILLYDVRQSRIERNVLEGNRVGIYMENAAENRLTDNDLIRNFVGIQMFRSDRNEMKHNAFVANVIEASEKESGSNRLTGNYWDSFQGLDLTNDGISELPFSVRPFYQNVIAGNSAYQLFFQSPGMNFLSEMFSGGVQAAKDDAPLMKLDIQEAAARGRTGDNVAVAAVGFVLLAAAISIIVLGGIRT
ncbi:MULTISPECIES: right-handed parallel beta-helix repeat-containing protein [Paenibacillus]|nr:MULTISPECIES: NosD domain-containing protein [Paenibacillus]